MGIQLKTPNLVTPFDNIHGNGIIPAGLPPVSVISFSSFTLLPRILRLQTTYLPKTNRTSRESRPKPRQLAVPTPTGKCAPAAAAPETIKISAETVKGYEIVRKDGSWKAAQVGKFKMPQSTTRHNVAN
jgi:hypothetical protein